MSRPGDESWVSVSAGVACVARLRVDELDRRERDLEEAPGQFDFGLRLAVPEIDPVQAAAPAAVRVNRSASSLAPREVRSGR